MEFPETRVRRAWENFPGARVAGLRLETSHQSSMLSHLFSTDVELLVEICHLVLQILNHRAIRFDLSLRPRLRPAVVQPQEDAAVRFVPRKGILSQASSDGVGVDTQLAGRLAT